MVALIGQTTFHGRVYRAVHTINLRIEYVITGPDITQVSAISNSVQLIIKSKPVLHFAVK
jgi:hypothetical protein